jgi:transposase
MWHVGIDLHRLTVVIAAVDDEGNSQAVRRIECQDRQAIIDLMHSLQPFRAVIEATGTYRWLYELLAPLGTVLLAHPLRLRAMVQRRSKTDKLDCQLLANLLRINQIPLAYIPPPKYQRLRDVTRHRARLSRQAAAAKIQLRGLLARHNLVAPYKTVCGVRGCRWLSKQEFGAVDNLVRDELLLRLEHFQKQMAIIDAHLEQLRTEVPEVEAIRDIRGIGLYTALLIIGELGEVERFRTAKQVGSYSGLTSRVRQSGDHCYRGAITREGSPWLRWILVEAAMKATREDVGLKNFYQRIRKRSGAKKARVAVARKLVEICWKRLIGWHGRPAASA